MELMIFGSVAQREADRTNVTSIKQRQDASNAHSMREGSGLAEYGVSTRAATRNATHRRVDAQINRSIQVNPNLDRASAAGGPGSAGATFIGPPEQWEKRAHLSTGGS
jgi:hypothetical protein